MDIPGSGNKRNGLVTSKEIQHGGCKVKGNTALGPDLVPPEVTKRLAIIHTKVCKKLL